MEKSDVIIIDSPTYCYEMTGQLKTLFDHFGYMWLPHRPRQSMFNKVGIVISTAAGAGARKVTKSLAQQMFWIGIPKTFQYSKNVNASSWETVSSEIKESIEQDTSKLSKKTGSILGNMSANLILPLIYIWFDKGINLLDYFKIYSRKQFIISIVIGVSTFILIIGGYFILTTYIDLSEIRKLLYKSEDINKNNFFM